MKSESEWSRSQSRSRSGVEVESEGTPFKRPFYLKMMISVLVSFYLLYNIAGSLCRVIFLCIYGLTSTVSSGVHGDLPKCVTLWSPLGNVRSLVPSPSRPLSLWRQSSSAHTKGNFELDSDGDLLGEKRVPTWLGRPSRVPSRFSLGRSYLPDVRPSVTTDQRGTFLPSRRTTLRHNR